MWKDWIAGKIVVFKGTFDPVLGHAIGVSGDTEGDVRGGGSILVKARGAKLLERDRSSAPCGEKEKPVFPPALVPAFIEPGDLVVKGHGHSILLPAVALETNEREVAVRFSVFGFAIGEAGSLPNLRQSAALGSAL